MAAFNDIKITHQTRPCWVDGRRAMFHRWTDSARPVKPRGQEQEDAVDNFQLHSVHGLVEYEDGTVARVWPNTIRFADSAELFAGCDWTIMEDWRDAKDSMPLPFTYSEEVAAASTQAVARNCLTCGYKNPNETHCFNIGHKCSICEADSCRCRDCIDGMLWVPKVGSALCG